MARVARRFTRVEPRRRARAFVLGLLSDLPRKNCWTIAGYVGDSGPAGMQHLLRKAVWDADAVRDDIRTVAVEHLGAADAILVVDETGDVKKGVHTVGVRRQYTGTAGRIENAQVGVFLTCTTAVGHTLIDRELHLPASWTDDTRRRAAAGVPEDTVFATKTELARRMLVRALDGGATAAWVTGDEVHGAASALRAAGAPLVVGPPQPPYRRVGFLSLLPAVVGGAVGPGAGRAPGPNLALVAPLDHVTDLFVSG
ncbi:IS701 family transposase [Saccharothrix syringae]|uniref:IS701 family transposase n=1 Tax=Saccharothrix syringae TaxID=103733 RepID=A0A5Q0H463_SACSY|nr:IS701 family transposase [Saccharothrix syringae]